MEQMNVYKDLKVAFDEYFYNHKYLLPEGVVLEKVSIIGNSYIFPIIGKTQLANWEVIFRGDLGNPQWIQNYDLSFEGLQLIDVKQSINKNE